MKHPRQRPTLVILDDEPRWVDNYTLWLSDFAELKGVSVQPFCSDDDAARYVRAHADDIVGLIQDLNRGPQHEYTGGVEGIRFLDEVIARYAPSARTLVISASANRDQVRQLYGSASYAARILDKAELDLSVLQDQIRWLLDIEESRISEPDAQHAPMSIEVPDLPWQELREYLTRQPNYLHAMDPRMFERLVAELFHTKGWEVELTASTRDGGYDIIAIRRNQPTSFRALIEAKRFSPDRPVSVSLVRSLYAVRQLAHASQVVLATSSHVSRVAKKEFTHVVPWELDFLERDQILAWCRDYRAVHLIQEPGV